MSDEGLPVGKNPERKSKTFLPKYFQTPTNNKFLNSTVDQLFQAGQVEKLNGFVGERQAPARKIDDNYIDTFGKDRNDYQLDVNLVKKDELGNIRFTKDYLDYIGSIKAEGGNVSNHSKLNSQEFYAWNPHIDYDKFTNFREYYWLPNGPNALSIKGQGKNVISTYTVTTEADDDNDAFVFSPNGFTKNPTLKLYRGQTYKFQVDSPGHPMAFALNRTFLPGKTLDDSSANISTIYTDGIKIIPEEIDDDTVPAGTTYFTDAGYLEKGIIEFTVPEDAPDVLYYLSQYNINTSGVFTIANIEENTEINVEEEILGKKTYTTNDKWALSNGMKVYFLGTVTPTKYSTGNWYVEGVGEKIKLIAESDLEVPATFTTDTDIGFSEEGFDTLPFSEALSFAGTKDYICMKRDSADRNSWARYNRWTHKEVIQTTNTLLGIDSDLAETARAKRPIIEFDAGLQLFNHGWKNKTNVDLVDDYTTDVFSNIEGAIGYNVDTVDLADGMRVLFTADPDSFVAGKIFRVTFLTHLNTRTISLIEEPDSTPVTGETVLSNKGKTYAGKMLFYNGIKWQSAQDKTSVNQFPLFDMFDKNGISLSDETTYPASSFKGNKIFSYKIGEGSVDSELGFALKYKNIANIGDIVFTNNQTQETYAYQINDTLTEINSDTAYFKKYDYYGTNFVYTNSWIKANLKSKQSVIRQFFGNEITNNLPIDFFDNSNTLTDLSITVRKNNKLLFANTDYTISAGLIKLTNDLVETDIVVVKGRSRTQKNNNGFYETPKNLVSNPLNNEVNEFTLGEVNNHVSTVIEEQKEFNGLYPGVSNLRDLGDLKPFGRTFVQHSGPINLPLYHLTSENANIIEAIEYASTEYLRFKNKFISFAGESGFDGSVKKHVDFILKNISVNSKNTAPFFFSDMIAPGEGKLLSYIVKDISNPFYNLSQDFNLTTVTNRSVLVYKNNVQLIHKKDYEFQTGGFVKINASIVLDDKIDIYEYDNTDGMHIPSTPSKLGIYPKYEPEIITDNTYPVSKKVIRGHDGSFNVAYDDFRDDLLLELEKRIFNNIKVEYDTSIFDIHDFLPGTYRDTGVSINDINNILIKDFSDWSTTAGFPEVDGIGTIIQGNSFTYNYQGSVDKFNNNLTGYWRNVYRNAYDTDIPHLKPWEMLGFTIKPTWWETVYGPAPYTRQNTVMWEDIEKGAIKEPGKIVKHNKKFVRPGLSEHPPSDDDGNLLSPLASGLVREFSFITSKRFFGFGDQHVSETAWRRSASYPFAVIKALILSFPAQVFGLTYDRSRIKRDPAGLLVYSKTDKRLRLSDISMEYTFENDTPIFTSGLINYITSYIASDIQLKIEEFYDDFQEVKNNIGFKLGGFADKENLKIVLDSRTPLNKGNIFVPPENYDIVLKTSNSQDSLSYSGIVIEKTTGGFRVSGYDKRRPYFLVSNNIPSANDPIINVGGISESFVDWASNKTYISGQIVKFQNVFYRAQSNHVSQDTFDDTLYSPMKELPIVGGTSARFNRNFYKNNTYKLDYNTVIPTVQETVDFILGYGNYLEENGFIFDFFNTAFESVENFSLAAKEFLFFTSQAWSSGTLLTVSPAANKLKFVRDNYIVANVESGRNSILNSEGNSIKNTFTNFERDAGNEFAVKPVDTNDGIFFCNIDLIQKEHVVIIDNTTVFNDIIYDPEPGFKQDRLKVVGYRTEWNGAFSIPGFVYLDGRFSAWKKFKDYKIGDLVKQNQFYYIAKVTHTSQNSFENSKWQILDDKPQSKLLSNMDYKSAQFEDFYDLDSDNFDSEQQRLAQHLIGYQKRQYLENIINDEISQYKFFQGFIQDKGTKNVLTKLFDKLSTNTGESLEFYEEWGLRVGQYGAVDSFKTVEYKLQENKFQISPQPVELVPVVDNTRTDLIYQYPLNDVYSKPNDYDHKPFPLLTTEKEYTKTAGYVRNDQINFIVKTTQDILALDINNVNIGDNIWVTQDKQSWNVLNVFKLENYVTNITKTTLGINVTFRDPVNFQVDDIVGFYNVNEEINGFRLAKVIASNEVEFFTNTPITTDSIDLTDSTLGTVVVLNSVRFDNIEKANDYLFTNDIFKGEKIWVDDVDSKWQVLENTSSFTKTNKVASPGTSDEGFASSISANKFNNILAIGRPGSGSYGVVEIYDRVINTQAWQKIQTLEPGQAIHDSNSNYGQAVALTESGNYLFVGAPNASNVKTKFKGEIDPVGSYSAGDIVSDRGILWKAKNAVNGDLSTLNDFTQDWESVGSIPADISGNGSSLSNQGIVYVYKRNTGNNTYEDLTQVVSQTPLENGQYGRQIEARVNKDGESVAFIHSLDAEGRINFLENTTTNEDLFSYSRDRSYKGSFANTKNYYTGDIVFYAGNLYQAKTNVFSSAWDIASWSQLDSYVDYQGYIPPSDMLYSESDILGVASGSLIGYKFDVSSDAEVIVMSGKTSTMGYSVSIYRRQTTGSSNRYVYYQTLTLEDSTQGFATDIAISPDGNTLIISSPLDDTQGIDTGRVYIYENTTSGFSLAQSVYPPLGDENELFGYSLAWLNNKFAVYSYNGDQEFVTSFDVYSLLKESDEGDYILDNTSALSGSATSFDNASTRFTSENSDAGKIYIFEKTGNKYLYAEKTSINDSNSLSLKPYLYGNDNILYKAMPGNKQTNGNIGVVHEFFNSGNTSSWTKLAEKDSTVNLKDIKSVFLYDIKTQSVVQFLDYIDPIQGKIPGPSEQELSYKLPYDPAQYNIGTTNTGSGTPWDTKFEGKLWWDLSTVKWYNPYQGTTEYKSNTWNQLVPGYSVDVYEWVSSTLLPSEWDELADTTEGLAQGISGKSKYGDTTYSLYSVYDAEKQSSTNKYFYWVKNKKIIPNDNIRKISANAVALQIADPASTGYRFIEFIGNDRFVLNNCDSLINDSNTVLHIDYYSNGFVDQNIHTEYQIISENLSTSVPNEKIVTKYIDSLAGYDSLGKIVPDPDLGVSKKYGIENSPRQSMFVNRVEALKQVIERANLTLEQNLIVDDFDLSRLTSTDKQPSLNTGRYDVVVDTRSMLQYVAVAKVSRCTLTPIIEDGKIKEVTVTTPGRGYNATHPPVVEIEGTGTGAKVELVTNSLGQVTQANVIKEGNNYSDSTLLTVRKFSVLVKADETLGNRWAIYSFDAVNIGQEGVYFGFSKSANQAYNVNDYWSYIDWYETGYSAVTPINHYVDSSYQLDLILTNVGDVVKIANIGSGGWLLLEKIKEEENVDYTVNFKTIGRQNGTVKFNTTLYDRTSVGYDVSGFDSFFYDKEPTKEIRIILETLRDNIFVDNLKVEWNKIFFVGVRFALYEQKNVDWIFKTSFVKAKHNIGDLLQKVTFKNDNLENYQDYIAEVKPYATKIREYISAYNKTEATNTAVTDFDFSPYYSPLTNSIVTSNARFVDNLITDYSTIVDQYPQKYWYDNTKFEIEEIIIHKSGSGYTEPMVVTISGGNGPTLKGFAYITSGKVSKIEVDTAGQKYSSAPTVTIEGGAPEGGSQATAYAYIGNSPIKNMHLIMKFDRTSGVYTYTDINKTVDGNTDTNYLGTGSKTEYNLEWPINVTKNNLFVSVDGVESLSSEYTPSNVKDNSKGYDRFQGKITFNTAPKSGAKIRIEYKLDTNFLSAEDRINQYYNPTTGMFGKDLSQVMKGVDYDGVQLDSIDFGNEQGFDVAGYGTQWDTYDNTYNDEIITLDGSTIILQLTQTLETGVQYNVYLNNVRIDDPNYDGSTVTANPNAKMQTITGDGTTNTINFEPIAVTTKANDVVVVRRSTSDGSFTPNEEAYDISLSGGDLPYTTAQGLSSGEIVVDGDDFVTPTTSGGPEELVPGQLNDTLDLRVFSKVQDGHSMITVNSYTLDGSTLVFPIESLPQSIDATIVKVNNLPINPTNYTVDFPNKQLVLKSTYIQPTNGTLSIFSIGDNGENIIEVDFVKGDGSRKEFITSATWDDTHSALVTLNGKIQVLGTDVVIFKSNSNKFGLRFGTAPVDGSIITYSIYSSASQTYSQVVVDRSFIADGTRNVLEFNEETVPFSKKPLTHNILVRVKDKFLKAGYNIRHTMTSARQYGIETWQFPNYGTIESDEIMVLINSTLLSPDLYTWDPINGRINFITDSTGKIGDILEIYILGSGDYFFLDTQVEMSGLAEYPITKNTPIKFALADDSTVVNAIAFSSTDVPGTGGDTKIIQLFGFLRDLTTLKQKDSTPALVTIDGDSTLTSAVIENISYVESNNLTFKRTPFLNELVEVYLFSNHDIQKFDRISYDVRYQSAGLLEGSQDYITRNLLTRGFIKLNSTIIDAAYAWVIKNGTLLTPNVDYIIPNTLDGIQLNNYPADGDTIEVFHFSGTEMKPKYGFRIFKDMLDRTHYKRLNDENTYQLASDLNWYDTSINLVSSEGIEEPNVGSTVPGVIFIEGERIEYFQKTGNNLRQLRRGTLGTGTKQIYLKGTSVTGQGLDETIPYKDEIKTLTLIGDGSTTATAYMLDYIPQSIDEIDVYVAGKKLRKTSISRYNQAIAQDSTEADETVAADFSLAYNTDSSGNIVTADVVFATPPANGVKIEIIRKTGKLWNEILTNTTTKTLSDSNNKIARFITEKSFRLAK